LSPVLSHTTPLLGWLSPEQPFETLFPRLLQYVSFTPLNNAAGSPGISLPMGATPEGLPVAVHFSGAHGDEKTLLELAFELEQAKGGWRRIEA
jgi:amidase